MNIEQARFNMVEQQIRPWNVLDQHVLDLLLEMRREDFVPAAYRNLAFVDMEIPLGHGEVMLTPKAGGAHHPGTGHQEDRQSAGSRHRQRLHDGHAGQRRQTRLQRRDRSGTQGSQAEEKLRAHGIRNVTLEQGDAAHGWDRHGTYDVIVLTGSVPVLPEAFFASLNPGGRMFAVVGDAPMMEGNADHLPW